MEIPTPPQAVAALAAFVRERLTEVSSTLAPLLVRSAQLDVVPVTEHDRSVIDHARQLAGVIVGAAAPFAPTSYARARLIRQMHASGLLTDEEIRRTAIVLDVDEQARAEERSGQRPAAADQRAARDADQRAARDADQRAARDADQRAARDADQRAARDADQRAARDAGPAPFPR